MNILQFKKIHYPDGKPQEERREIFNCRNSVYMVNGWRPDILFIGDSITERFEVYPYFSQYGNIVNRGIGGESTSSLKTRLYYDAILLKPKVCVVAEGVNNTAILWKIEHDGKTVTEKTVDEVLRLYESDMLYIVRQLKTNGIIPIVGSVLPIGVKDVRNRVIIRENEILKNVCDKEKVFFVDYYSRLVSDDGITMCGVTFGDDLHPHAEGYNLMAELLYPIFDKIFEN